MSLSANFTLGHFSLNDFDYLYHKYQSQFPELVSILSIDENTKEKDLFLIEIEHYTKRPKNEVVILFNLMWLKYLLSQMNEHKTGLAALLFFDFFIGEKINIEFLNQLLQILHNSTSKMQEECLRKGIEYCLAIEGADDDFAKQGAKVSLFLNQFKEKSVNAAFIIEKTIAILRKKIAANKQDYAVFFNPLAELLLKNQQSTISEMDKKAVMNNIVTKIRNCQSLAELKKKFDLYKNNPTITLHRHKKLDLLASYFRFCMPEISTQFFTNTEITLRKECQIKFNHFMNVIHQRGETFTQEVKEFKKELFDPESVKKMRGRSERLNVYYEQRYQKNGRKGYRY